MCVCVLLPYYATKRATLLGLYYDRAGLPRNMLRPRTPTSIVYHTCNDPCQRAAVRTVL